MILKFRYVDVFNFAYTRKILNKGAYALKKKTKRRALGLYIRYRSNYQLFTLYSEV